MARFDDVIALTAKAVSFTLPLFRRLGAHRRVGSIRLGLPRGPSGQCSLAALKSAWERCPQSLQEKSS